MHAPATPAASTPPATEAEARERLIVALVAAVQLVNVLEFMIVMPLGPDFARALGIPADRIPLVGGAYTASAAVAGLLGALFLDRFDRRPALAIAMTGLVAATALGGFAVDLRTLVAARVLAGIFGGPATSLGLSIVADVVPAARRGRAMAVVMGAFSVASVLGVPAGLELARLGGWRAPLWAIAGLAAVVTGVAIVAMPPMRRHLEAARAAGRAASLGAVVTRPGAPLTLFTVGLLMISQFTIVPNIPTYLQHNGGFPREHFHWLYFAGGSASLLLLVVTGRIVDRVGALPVVIVSATVLSADLALGLLDGAPRLSAYLFFVLFMGGTAIRTVALNALSSRVPPPTERARFQSAMSAVQHLAAASGAILSTRLLVARPDGGLDGMPRLAALSITITLIIPLLVAVLERRVRHTERRAAAATP